MGKFNLGDIEKAFKKIEKDNSDVVLDLESYEDIPRIPTRSPELNKILGGVGVKGIPYGRVIEVAGMESNGKSLLGYILGSAFQDVGEYTAWFDTEQCFSEEFAIKQGLNTSKELFKVLRPLTITDTFEYMEMLLESGVRMLIWDSVALTPSRQELDKGFDAAHMGVRARAISLGMTKLLPLIAKYDAVLVCINHLKVDLGVTYGDNNVCPGGRAIPFASSIRLRVRRSEYIMQGEEPIGMKMVVRTLKNKTSAPNKSCELSIYYETGLDSIGGILDEFCDQELINKKGGGNFDFLDDTGEQVKIRGKLKLIDYFKEHGELFTSFKIRAGIEVDQEETEE